MAALYVQTSVPPATVARTRRDERAFLKKHRAREVPRCQLFVFPSSHRPCLLFFFMFLFSPRITKIWQR